MKSLYNIDKSAFKSHPYVGYCAGNIWKIFGRSGCWTAYRVEKEDGKTNILAGFSTLKEISEQLTMLENEQ